MNDKKKCVNIIAYIIVVILAVFYLATLVLGSKLDVSDEYKLYYVDGELSKWPGENGLDYYFGNTEIYDISKLEEYKKLLEEQKLYGDIITDDEEEADEVNEDSVESNRDSAIDKYFQKMLAAENNYVSEDADDNSTADKDEDKTIASALNIPYRYTKGFYSLHTGIYTNKGNEAALYYRFVTRVEKDIVLEVYGASYNTDTKVYANDEYIGTITAYNETEGAVKYHKKEPEQQACQGFADKYHKNEYGDREREDKVNDNLNTLKIPADIVGNDGIVKISFVPEETVNIYDYTSAISNDNFKKYKGFRITSVNMFY